MSQPPINPLKNMKLITGIKRNTVVGAALFVFNGTSFFDRYPVVPLGFVLRHLFIGWGSGLITLSKWICGLEFGLVDIIVLHCALGIIFDILGCFLIVTGVVKFFWCKTKMGHVTGILKSVSPGSRTKFSAVWFCFSCLCSASLWEHILILSACLNSTEAEKLLRLQPRAFEVFFVSLFHECVKSISHSPEFLSSQRRAPFSVLNVLLLVYVIAVNVPSGWGTPHTRDSLLLRSMVSMLTSFPLNAGVAGTVCWEHRAVSWWKVI